MASPAAEMKMPQTGGAQREPSMEEILASIRRIIEDSDQVRKPEQETTAFGALNAARKTDVDAFRQEFDDSATEAGSSAEHRHEAAPIAEEPEVSGSNESVASAPEREAPTNEVDMVDYRAAEAPAEQDPVDLPEDLLGDISDEEDLEIPIAANSDAASEKPAQMAGEKPSIISEYTGRQVAAAFGELSQAFMASRQRSFDEMAAEMMRPMLQEWLDNNLPTIVEKLVREEIERVARGT